MHMTHEEQKEHARKVAEHHMKHGSVDGMRPGEVKQEMAANKEELLTNTP